MTFKNTIIIVSIFCLFYNCNTKSEYDLNDKTSNINKSIQKIKTKLHFSINSNNLSEQKGFYVLTDFLKDNNGTIYLSDRKNVRIARLNKNGKILNYFLKKGKGPGEFSSYFKLQLTDNYLWIIEDRKIAKFKKDGTYVEEFKLDNFYSSIVMLNDKKFLAFKNFDISIQKLKFEKILGLFELKTEKIITIYHKEANVGKTYVQINKRNIALFFAKGIIPDVIYSYNNTNKKIFICRNDNYNIYIKTLDGTTISIIKKEYQLSKINTKYKNKILAGFGNLNKKIKIKIEKIIPENFCLIKNLTVLDKNYLLVHRIVENGQIKIDIFDKNNTFISSFDLSSKIKNKYFKIVGNILSVIDSKNDEIFYKEYKIYNYN